jgi:hypothetical protein
VACGPAEPVGSPVFLLNWPACPGQAVSRCGPPGVEQGPFGLKFPQNPGPVPSPEPPRGLKKPPCPPPPADCL